MRRNPTGDWTIADVAALCHEFDIICATVPDLPGCMSDGETPEEAITNVQEAIAASGRGCARPGTPDSKAFERTRAGELTRRPQFPRDSVRSGDQVGSEAKE